MSIVPHYGSTYTCDDGDFMPSQIHDETADYLAAAAEAPKHVHVDLQGATKKDSFSSPSMDRNFEFRDTPKRRVSTKVVYLIRHGESLGQKADNINRRKDKNLIDCGLSKLGIWQAEKIKEMLHDEYDSIELVISSPLTRALQTATLAFPNKPILIHYDLREVGTMIPENIPRPMKQVLSDLDVVDKNNIDYTTYQPENWPRNHDVAPKVIRGDKIRQVFQSVIANRPEKTIAIVCHYHVIRCALSTPIIFNSPPTRKSINNNQHAETTTGKTKVVGVSSNNNNNDSITSNNVLVSPSARSITSTSGTPQRKQTIFSQTPTKQKQNQQQQQKLKSPSPIAIQMDIRPMNAIPIKCQFDVETGQLTMLPW